MNKEKEALNYQREVLFQSEEFEIVTCSWQKGSVSAKHSHGISECLVWVQEGEFENENHFGLKSEKTVVRAGETIYTPRGVEHEIRCVSATAKTMHVYLPKIKPATGRGHFASESLGHVREKIDLALAANGKSWNQVMKVLGDVRAHSVSANSPFFMNQLFGGVWPTTLAADAVVAETRTTLATFEASPALTAVELEVVDRLCAQIGWPADSRDGIAVPGGSAANFMAVHCARQKFDPEVRKRGNGGRDYKIFASEVAHYSMKKACLALGLGTDAFVAVKADPEGRMIPAELSLAIQQQAAFGATPLMVCATIGTTVHGAFDSMTQLAAICKPLNLWLHADGAWGGPAIFSKSAQSLVKGIELADSMTFDAHKLFGSSLTASFFLTKHRSILQDANDVTGGDYIFHTNEIVRDRGRLSWQCGRGADALAFWTLWQHVGTDGLGGFVDRLFTIRDQAVSFIKDQPRLQLITQPEYLNICVRVLTPEGKSDPTYSQFVRERLRQTDQVFVNFSADADGTFLRLILAHPRLEFTHVEQIFQSALAIQ